MQNVPFTLSLASHLRKRRYYKVPKWCPVIAGGSMVQWQWRCSHQQSYDVSSLVSSEMGDHLCVYHICVMCVYHLSMKPATQTNSASYVQQDRR